MARADYGRKIEQEMIDGVLAAIDSGDLPWTKPWSEGVGPPILNTSVDGHRYRGMNQLWLSIRAHLDGYMTPQWATYNAWAKKDIQVNKGESGTKVVYVKHNWKEDEDGDTQYFGMTYKVWTIFNREQTDAEPLPQPEVIPEEEYIADVLKAYEELGVKWQQGGARAYYSKGSDSITIPVQEAFNSNADWASTALHELAHWTGHNTRLDRLNMGTWGDDRYAFEELVAETASAWLCGIMGVPIEGLQHTEYLGIWGQRIKADGATLRKALAEAGKVVDFILDGPPAKDE
jgi:antirestriction protein ArdC